MIKTSNANGFVNSRNEIDCHKGQNGDYLIIKMRISSHFDNFFTEKFR